MADVVPGRMRDGTIRYKRKNNQKLTKQNYVKDSSEIRRMPELCIICNILLCATCVGYIYLSFLFTSTLVLTISSGFILAWVFFVFCNHSCNGRVNCFQGGIILSFGLIGVGLLSSAAVFGLRYIHITTTCYLSECCDSSWIPSNITGLSFLLNKKLYGQPLVVATVVKLLRGHVDGHPHKPTVVSLHGLPGTGKSYLMKMIIDQMYLKGMDSKYVHYLSATKDFPHERLVDDYKDTLDKLITDAMQECPKSVFIIDEIDQLHPGLIDTLRPYIDTNQNINSLDYKQALYFFLSNTAGDRISETFSKMTGKSGSRTNVRLKEMEEIVRNTSLNEKNGLYQSSIVKNGLITGFIPFLPLEREHVKQCIVDGLFEKGFYEYEYQVDKEKVEAIADEMIYVPKDTKRFSLMGCKRVREKIDLIMQEAVDTD